MHKVTGELEVENDSFQESHVVNQSLQYRRSHVEKERSDLSITKQCELLSF